MLKYKSTRGNLEEYTSAQAIIKGLADDRGLYVPTEIPEVDLKLLSGLGYKAVAKAIIGSFFDDFTEEEITACIDGAYDEKFSGEDIVSLVEEGGAWFLELYHGKTSAFKDMALSILPYLLTTAVKKEGEERRICILTATSGDTGKAALEGFKDVDGTEIFVFYPEDGVSDVQKAQMITQEGSNTKVYGIKGNFDDAQTGVKNIFNNTETAEKLEAKGVKLSSANSINVGRLIPQVAYYVYSYLKLLEKNAVKEGEPVNVVVPTGNFGNILAAYYASLIGVPVNKFICASNENNVLTDFINSGIYDTKREFYLTNSPSMDILISSNLERLLYHMSGEDGDYIKGLMSDLDDKGAYSVSDSIKDELKKFHGGFATIEDTNRAIGDMYNACNYLMDTHTAVAYKVYQDYKNVTGDNTVTIIASTASPYKFARSVANSIGIAGCDTDFQYVTELEKSTGIPIPQGLRGLDKKEVRHTGIIDKGEMEEKVLIEA